MLSFRRLFLHKKGTEFTNVKNNPESYQNVDSVNGVFFKKRAEPLSEPPKALSNLTPLRSRVAPLRCPLPSVCVAKIEKRFDISKGLGKKMLQRGLI